MSNHLRPASIVPHGISSVLLQLVRTRRDWITVSEPNEQDDVNLKVHVQISDVSGIISSPAQYLTLLSMSHWLADGPKVFRPTKQQMEALAEIEVNINFDDYQQPFPSMLVETLVPPYKSCLVSKHGRMIVTTVTGDGNNDKAEALSTILHKRNGEGVITVEHAITRQEAAEAAINLIDGGSVEMEKVVAARKCIRIAVNSCLALTNYGCAASSYLFAHEAANDKGLVHRGGASGERAAQRLRTAPLAVSFTQDVRLHTEERSEGTGEGAPTGREVRTHWRRGHWARQPHGEGRTQRKLIFRRPVLVRSDLFAGDTANTSSTYKG